MRTRHQLSAVAQLLLCADVVDAVVLEQEQLPRLVQAAAQGALEAMRLDGGQASGDTSVECIQHTGGTCMIQGCAAWRGPTTCSVGRCFCQEGHCAGSDGQCYEARNRLVGQHLRFRNARWPEYYLYFASVFPHSLYVSKDPSRQGDLRLLELPGQDRSFDKEVLLSSEAFSNWVAAMGESDDSSTFDLKKDSISSLHTTLRDSSESTRSITARAVQLKGLMSTPVSQLTVRFVEAPRYEGQPNGTTSFMISSWKYPDRYMMVSRASWDVAAGRHDPGVGGYWISEPPLNMSLPRFRGEHCSFDCGSYGSGSSFGNVRMPTRTIVWIVLGVAGGCIGSCILGRLRYGS